MVIQDRNIMRATPITREPLKIEAHKSITKELIKTKKQKIEIQGAIQDRNTRETLKIEKQRLHRKKQGSIRTETEGSLMANLTCITTS